MLSHSFASFATYVVLLCASLRVVASSPVGTSESQDIALTSPNATDSAANYPSYKIQDTQLSLVLVSKSNPIIARDTLLLFVECIYSATERINKGGKEATDPVQVIQHKNGRVQIQMEGFHDHLDPWKSTQVFYGMATLGAKLGYWHSTFMVLEDQLGYIARIDIM
ncbi:MAG: hypothetical protein Q9201_002682 [Fulgogasparrea decipioides]